MKWYHALLAACSIALFVPSMASAQPHPGVPGPVGPGPVAGPHPGPGPQAPGHPGKKGKKDDHRPGPVAPAPGPHHGPAVPPPPAPGPKPKPAPAVNPGRVHGPAPHFAPRPGFDHRRHGMHPDDFRLYINHINRIVVKADRVSYILSYRNDYWYTTYQVRDILNTLPYESDRLNVACSLYPRVIDPQHWNIIFDNFSSYTMRDRLAACSR